MSESNKDFWKGTPMADLLKRISELENKVETLDMEKKLKIDYMLKMNQLVENDKAHQAFYDKLFKEIAELRDTENFNRGDFKRHEKMINELKEHWTRQQEEIDHLEKEFKRLEKVAMIVENKFNKEIAELRASSASHTEDLNNDNDSFLQVSKQLNELKDAGSARQTEKMMLNYIGENKEKIAEAKEQIINNEWYIANNIEVLRDHIMAHINISEHNLDEWFKQLDEQLAKLDVPKEQTVKSCNDCIRDDCSYQGLNERFICDFRKSGGEKEFRCGHCGNIFLAYHDGTGINTGFCPKCFNESDTIGLDSKPPEPNLCDNCWKYGNYDVFMCPTIEKCIPKRDYSPKGPEDRLPGGTGQEPREDKGWVAIDRNKQIVVKREDLQFLYEWFGDDDVWDEDADHRGTLTRIKEAYGIE